jgi:hypothetical protein
VNAQLAALQAQLADIQAKANAPGVVKTAGMFAWTKTKCGARLVADFYAFLKGARTILFFGLSCALALANELEAIDLTPYVAKLLPEGAHIDTAGAIVLFSLAGIGLRLISKTPAVHALGRQQGTGVARATPQWTSPRANTLGLTKWCATTCLRRATRAHASATAGRAMAILGL